MVTQKEKVARPFELLLDQKRIAQRVKKLGAEITADYAGQRLVLVGVLKGCVVFMADLMRHIELPCEHIILGGSVAVALKGRHVLIVDGIVDSARTVSVIYNRLQVEEPASLEIVTLLDKPASHRNKVQVKYKGFSIGNEFVIGYGLDNTQLYRNLPFVGHLIDH